MSKGQKYTDKELDVVDEKADAARNGIGELNRQKKCKETALEALQHSLLGVATTSYKDDPPAWRTDPDPPEPESWGFDDIHADSDDSSSLNLGSTYEDYDGDNDDGSDEKLDPPRINVN